MLDINPEKITHNALVEAMGLPQYTEIMKQINPECPKWQKKFNSFYKIRRDANWLKKYYELFKQIQKEKQIDFKTILGELKNSTKRIEPSFASKMLATVNPDMPIWDKYVMKNFKIIIPKQDNKLEKNTTIECYAQLCEEYKKFLKGENGKECVQYFDKSFPEYKSITDIKKIDCYLWKNRH